MTGHTPFLFPRLHFQLHIWDTAGQERYKTITQTYYRNAHGVLLAYDITRERTFYNLSNWLDDIRKYCGQSQILGLRLGNYLIN